MRRIRTYTDAELGRARHTETGEYVDGPPQQWRAYLDTLTSPETDRPDYEVVAGPPIITLHGWWWQPGLDDMFLEVLGNAGYKVHIVRHVADALLLPRHPVGHVHILGDEGERTWFVLGRQHFTWSSFVRLACQTDTVQAQIGKWVQEGDDWDWEGAAAAQATAERFIRNILPPAHRYHRLQQLETD